MSSELFYRRVHLDDCTPGRVNGDNVESVGQRI